MPLLHRRVMVTGPRQYAHKLCAKLLNAGARPLWVPGVSIHELHPTANADELTELDAALQHLVRQGEAGAAAALGSAPAFTHVAFTSKNGIHAVLQRLAYLTGGMDAACDVLRGCGAALCALGADGQELARAGLPVHVSPKEASTQGLVRELVGLGQAAGARVLCPVPHVTGGLTEPPVVPRFLEALRAAGATAVRVPAYVTALGSAPEHCRAERALLEGGDVAAIAFSSTAEAQGLVHAMGGVEVLARAVRSHGVLLAAHGPYTAAGAADVLGLPVPCVSSNFAVFDGLVTALEQAFAEQEAQF